MPHDRRSILIAIAVALAGLVLAGRWLVPSSASPSTIDPVPTSAFSPLPRQASASDDGGPVLVHVVGAVHRPGVYQLPGGSRVRDAVRAAGGATPAAHPSEINLAERLADGEQVVLPGRGITLPAAAAAGPGSHGIVHLSSATADQLDALDGIGPTLAARIVAYRTQHGGFRRVDDLADVPGIGPAKLEALRAQVAP
jgi:competence protein ComEA